DDAHLAAGGRADLLFEGPALGAAFGEAGRDDDGRRHAPGGARAHQAGDGGGRGGDDGQVHDHREGRQVRVAVDAVYGRPPGVDRVDDAAEGVFQQVADENAADTAGGAAGPQHGDGARAEERVERVAVGGHVGSGGNQTPAGYGQPPPS